MADNESIERLIRGAKGDRSGDYALKYAKGEPKKSYKNTKKETGVSVEKAISQPKATKMKPIITTVPSSLNVLELENLKSDLILYLKTAGKIRTEQNFLEVFLLGGNFTSVRNRGSLPRKNFTT
jgi:hypothetical protein